MIDYNNCVCHYSNSTFYRPMYRLPSMQMNIIVDSWRNKLRYCVKQLTNNNIISYINISCGHPSSYTICKQHAMCHQILTSATEIYYYQSSSWNLKYTYDYQQQMHRLSTIILELCMLIDVRMFWQLLLLYDC